jgi:cell division protein ZapA
MAQVAVTIAGKIYRIDCDEGDEARLVALAEVVDTQVEGMRARFGEIGDRRLLIMAAISIADELVDMTRRVRELEAEAEAAPGRQSDWAERAVSGIEEAAALIQRIARELDATQGS